MFRISICTFLIVFFSLFIFPMSILAGPENTSLHFEITGGLLKDFEVTFDEKRNVTGSAPKDTEITILISVPSPHTEAEPFYDLLETYSYTIGSSGVFTQFISLPLDESIIQVTAILNEEAITQTCKIKRKPAEIKKELEKGLVLPASKIFVKGETNEK